MKSNVGRRQMPPSAEDQFKGLIETLPPACAAGGKLNSTKELKDLHGAYQLIAEVIHGLSLQPKFSLHGGCDEFNDAGAELDDLRIHIESRSRILARIIGGF